MNNPFDVYKNPSDYIEFLTQNNDDNFESEHFDRKECPRIQKSDDFKRFVDKNVKQTISAFANKDGGLLVIGISKDGSITGIDILNETQINELTNINAKLRNQSATSSITWLTDKDKKKRICLLYVPASSHAICDDLTKEQSAWIRQGAQNLLMSLEMRKQIEREKGIIDDELEMVCKYDKSFLDEGVVREFRISNAGGSEHRKDEDILFDIGALEKDEKGVLHFTKAGLLFFATNPQRILTCASIRLLKYEARSDDNNQNNTVVIDKVFTGSITKQIRDLRVYFEKSNFFKIYKVRRPDGGFNDEPELPRIAVDEAIVNALVHRDYAVKQQIECKHFKDAFFVENPGRIRQRRQNVPDHFKLDAVRLSHMPRNAKILEWLKSVRDDRGQEFVRALSEGTKKMQDEMVGIGLPSPEYVNEPSHTTVMLYSNAENREAKLRGELHVETQDYINLYELKISNLDGSKVDYNEITRQFSNALANKLESMNWHIDKLHFKRLTAHIKRNSINTNSIVSGILRFYPAYNFQLRNHWNKYYLCVDYTLEVKSICSLSTLRGCLEYSDLHKIRVLARDRDGWGIEGRLVGQQGDTANIAINNTDEYKQVLCANVIPLLPVVLIKKYLHNMNIGFDLSKEIKSNSLSITKDAAKQRADKINSIVEILSTTIFPLILGKTHIEISRKPAFLNDNSNKNGFIVRRLEEPAVEFSHHNETKDIRDGITRYGSYEYDPKDITIVPICLQGQKENMKELLNRLRNGKFKYHGSERTFSVKLLYDAIIEVDNDTCILNECRRLLEERPEWCGSQTLGRLFLVHAPQINYSSDDEKSPYYTVKHFLLEKGIPCQMVDTRTLHNADWKDLNLALNIVAKCGIAPWVLPGSIPDADFFVGLSYTSNYRKDNQRIMGYANVFNSYGRWEFYSGNTETCIYEERQLHFEKLVKETLIKLNPTENPNIYFHYSAKFSKEDCEAILRGARSVRPNGNYTFVWINTHSLIRLFNSRLESNGSLDRGGYVAGSDNQIYLSTSGDNPYRQIIGTPKPLEINVTHFGPSKRLESEIDLKLLANQILSLTKLNWASTDSICGEPITTKYASSIAYLTAAFLRINDKFKLHPVLERTPWFL